MLKKIVNIIVTLLLTVAVSGFTISRHYCGNHLVEVALFKVVKCSCGDRDCHTEVRQIKVNDNYSVSESLHLDAPVAVDLVGLWPAEAIYCSNSAPFASILLIEAPPPLTANPIAVLQSFRC